MAVSNEGVDRRRHGSPPRRNDDREGHYVFNLGENLTPRCPFYFPYFSLRWLILLLLLLPLLGYEFNFNAPEVSIVSLCFA